MSSTGPVMHRLPPSLGRLLFVSLLVMLNLPLFFTTITGMDLYGFFTLDPISAQPLPLVLSTVLSTTMAIAGYACYCWLRRQAWLTGDHRGPFTRGLTLSGVPVLLAYAPSIVLTSHGGKPGLIVVAGLMAGSLCITHALRDPETKLDPVVARYWFIGTVATILLFLGLSIGAMMLLYYVEQQPASGNLLWRWEYEWLDLGYAREQFAQRQRDALVGFTLTGSGFMIVVLGGSMLGAVLDWTRAPRQSGRPASRGLPGAPPWVDRIAGRLEQAGPSAPPAEAPEYVAVFDGYEIDITGSQYGRLVSAKDDVLLEVDLVVDGAAGDVFLRTGRTWTTLDFRVRDRSAGVRSGPFSLLCIYARHPGRRFTNRQLRALLQGKLSDRVSFNVGDFISQLQRRTPRLPVRRDDAGSFLDAAARVCFLDHRRGHQAATACRELTARSPAQ